jgi:hypothetical protein
LNKKETKIIRKKKIRTRVAKKGQEESGKKKRQEK